MARVLVNPRIGVEKAARDEATRTVKMKNIKGAFDQIVYDTVAKKYVPAQASDL